MLAAMRRHPTAQGLQRQVSPPCTPVAACSKMIGTPAISQQQLQLDDQLRERQTDALYDKEEFSVHT